MFTWSTKEYWTSEDFDFDYLEEEHGLYDTYEKAKYDAINRGTEEEDIVIIEF